jgi:hypothetical protein
MKKAAAEHAELTDGRGKLIKEFPRIPAVFRALRGSFCCSDE